MIKKDWEEGQEHEKNNVRRFRKNDETRGNAKTPVLYAMFINRRARETSIYLF